MTDNDNTQSLASIDYYLDSAPYGEGAVLVTGPWGSGKTSTIRAHMKSRDERLLAFEPLGDKHVYVSLYGVSSIDLVLERIFAARHPRLGSGPVKFMADIIGRGFNAIFRNAAVAKTDGAKVRRYLLNLKNATLVVDDLERAEMSIGEIMGYLNSFVEHERVKVIIIAHESEIDWPDYATQKEKLISKTVEISGSPSAAYDYFAARMRSDEAKEVAITNKSIALDAFYNTGTPNLRSLRAALDDFDRLVSSAGPGLRSSEEALATVLPLMIAIWTHLRAATISLSDFSNPSLLVYEAFLKSRFEGREGADTKVSTALKRHSDLTWQDPVVPISVLANMAASGRLDVDELNTAAARHSLLRGFQEAPAWIRFWRWPELSLTDYARAESDLRDCLADRTITDPGIILHVFGTSLDIMKRGGDPLKGDPVVVMRDYVQKLFAEGRLQTFSERYENFETATGYGGFGFAAVETTEFDRFRRELSDLLRQVLESGRKGESIELMARIKGGDFRCLFEPDDDGYYMTPILHYIPMSDFADAVLVDGTILRGASNAIKQRYNGFASTDHPLAVEGDWIVGVLAELRTRAHRLPNPYSSLVADKVDRLEADVKHSLGMP